VKNNLRLLVYAPTLRQRIPPRRVGKAVDDTAWNRAFGREFDFPYFTQGYVDADLGRDTVITDLIQQIKDGYALADASGNVLQTYRQLPNAEKARDSAVLRIIPEVDVESEADQADLGLT
jgi:hypothetical protein